MRKVPLWLFLLATYFCIVFIILFGWSTLHIYKNGKKFSPGTKNAIISIARLPTELSAVYNRIFPSRPHFENPLAVKNNNLKGGLTLGDKNYKTNDYLLVSSFDSIKKQPVVKLVGLSDGKTLYKWAPDISLLIRNQNPAYRHFDTVEKVSYRIFHPLLLNNGEVIFNDRLQLVKIDKDSRIVWSNNHVFRHTIEPDADGNLWCPSVMEDSKIYQEFSKDFRDDAIAKVSAANGKILFRKSVVEILTENGYQALILGLGPFENDPVHLNDVQPALTDSKYWQKGDLLVSIRNRSTVFLYRPSTNKILWLKTGPWLNQQDCDFVNDHQIGIFENHIAAGNSDGDDGTGGHSEEMIFDFSTSQVSTPYTGLFRTAKVGTRTEGTSQILANGDLYLEQANKGRVIIGDPQKAKLEYAERLNNKEISLFNGCRYMTAEEFSKVKF